MTAPAGLAFFPDTDEPLKTLLFSNENTPFLVSIIPHCGCLCRILLTRQELAVILTKYHNVVFLRKGVGLPWFSVIRRVELPKHGT